jgi:hypothetical protein
LVLPYSLGVAQGCHVAAPDGAKPVIIIKKRNFKKCKRGTSTATFLLWTVTFLLKSLAHASDKGFGLGVARRAYEDEIGVEQISENSGSHSHHAQLLAKNPLQPVNLIY